jgi:hypothetical protein
MKTFTIDDIRKLKPCYDPVRYLPENWQGTALDILRVTEWPPRDRLWVVINKGWIDDETIHLFAVWCARQALASFEHFSLYDNYASACDIAERRMHQNATLAEINAALETTWLAARDELWDAALDTAWAATMDPARNVAGIGAWVTVVDTAWDVARTAQVAKLIEMLESHENPTNPPEA